jgi:hypothetical protein
MDIENWQFTGQCVDYWRKDGVVVPLAIWTRACQCCGQPFVQLTRAAAVTKARSLRHAQAIGGRRFKNVNCPTCRGSLMAKQIAGMKRRATLTRKAERRAAAEKAMKELW